MTPKFESADGGEFVVLGRIIGPWGVKGWLKIQALADDPLTWKKMPRLWIEAAVSPAAWQEVVLDELRLHGDGLVAKLAEVDDRGAAESLSGALIGAPRDCLPEPADGEYYWGDLIGLRVINRAGDDFGTVQGLLKTGANDVLVVKAADGTERLLPFVGHVVLTVDLTRQEVLVAWELDW